MPGPIEYHRPASAAATARAYERARQPDKHFYSSGRWRSLRASFLRSHPLCMDCESAGRVTVAQHVHHVEPRKTRPDLAYKWTNLAALCQPCHNAREER